MRGLSKLPIPPLTEEGGWIPHDFPTSATGAASSPVRRAPGAEELARHSGEAPLVPRRKMSVGSGWFQVANGDVEPDEEISTSDPVYHPTAGVHTTIKSVRDAHGHKHYVYGQGGMEGRGVADHQNEPNNWQSRGGVDIICPPGTPIYAAFDGVIGKEFGPLKKHAADGPDSMFAGNRLTIDGAGDRAYYAHLDRFAEGIAPGVTVLAGQLIGYSGTAGNVHHLHIAFQNGNTEQLLAAARLPAATGTIAASEVRGDASPTFTPGDADTTDSQTGRAVLSVEPQAPELNYTPSPPQPIDIQSPGDANATDASGAAIRVEISSPDPLPAVPGGPEPPSNAWPTYEDPRTNPDMGAQQPSLDSSPADAGAGVEPERPDAAYLIPPPGGLVGGEIFDPVKAGADITRIESQLANFLPVVGQIKGIYEALSGYDVLSDDRLEMTDRVINLLPVLSAALKEMVVVGRLEEIAAEYRGADVFSKAMREVAVASGNADFLLDSMNLRIQALKEMERTAGAVEFIAIQETLDKLFELVDTLTDAAGLVGALPSGREAVSPPAPSPPKSADSGTPSAVTTAAAIGVTAASMPSADEVASLASFDPVASIPFAGDLGDPLAPNESMDFGPGIGDLTPIAPADALDFTPMDADLASIDSVSLPGFEGSDLTAFSDPAILAADDFSPAMTDGFIHGFDDFASHAGQISDLGMSIDPIAIGGDSGLASVDPSFDSGLAQSIDPGFGHDGGHDGGFGTGLDGGFSDPGFDGGFSGGGYDGGSSGGGDY